MAGKGKGEGKGRAGTDPPAPVMMAFLPARRPAEELIVTGVMILLRGWGCEGNGMLCAAITNVFWGVICGSRRSVAGKMYLKKEGREQARLGMEGTRRNSIRLSRVAYQHRMPSLA